MSHNPNRILRPESAVFFLKLSHYCAMNLD